MSNYENGSNTRRFILDTCKKMFYEKGYRNVSMNDIYKACFISRASLYYHFKDKESIRHEIHCELYIKNKHLIEPYCDKTEYHFLLAVYVFYYQFLNDSKTRRFLVEYVEDHIIYQPDSSAGALFRTCCKQMYECVFEISEISPLAIASVYSHNNCMILMAAQHPETYTAYELFQHLMTTAVMLWGIPMEIVTELQNNIEPYLKILPLETLDTTLM